MRTPMRRALFALVGLLLSPHVGWAQPAHADAQESESEDLIAKGVELRKQRRDTEALIAFERAYAQGASPRCAAQIALAHHALAHWREAERWLVVALSVADDPWIARNHGDLQDSLTVVQTHLAWLDVASNVAGAEVRVDGELVGYSPLARPLRVVAGDVAIEVSASGYPPMARTLQVAANSQEHTTFMFVEPAPAPRAGESPVMARLPAGHPRSGSRTAGWIALEGAAAFAVIGVGALVIRQWEAQIWDDDGQCGPTENQSRYARCGTNRDIGSAAQGIAIGAFVGAGIAGAASGVLLFGSSRSAPAPAMGRVECRVAGLGLACGEVF